MNNHAMRTAVVSLFLGLIVMFVTGCERPPTLTKAEEGRIEAILPPEEMIRAWVELDFPSSRQWPKDTFDTYRKVVDQVISQVRNGESITLEVPSVAPCYTKRVEVDWWVPHPTENGTTFDHFIETPYTYIEPVFGLPAREIGDAIIIQKGIELDATRRTLQWFASKGIYPINSTKRRP